MRSLSRQGVWSLVALSALGVFLFATTVLAQQGHSRTDLKQAFEKIEQRTRTAMSAPGVQKKSFPVSARTKATLIGGPRFQPVGLALEYDFELVEEGSREGSGQFVNPAKYTFHPKERFFLRLKTASPVQVALVQAYDDGRPDRLVLPDDKYPESYNTVTPDQGFVRYPVLMEMDDDTKPETMKIMAYTPDTLKNGGQISVEDVGGTPKENNDGLDLGAGGDDTLTTPNGVEFRGVKETIKKTAQTIASLHQTDKEFQRRTRFKQGAAVRESDPTVSTDPSQASVVAVNEKARVGVITVKIPKTPR